MRLDTLPPLLRSPHALMLLGGWLVLFLPVYHHAFNTLWQTDDQSHGPLILAVSAWLFWQIKDELAALESRGRTLLGGLCIAVGLLAYLFGQVFAFPFFSLMAQLPVALGLLLLYKGFAGARVAWFALFFLIFMAPLPGTLVDSATHVLKQWISVIVAELLHWLDYPVSRTGVTITVGQYQLLVADACSGMHSLYSLTALGTLYLYIVRRASWLHNTVMVLLILPTAFFANIVRVMILVFITYYIGEDAGRGFLHGFAGMALMFVSLSVLFAADSILLRLIRPRPPVAPQPLQTVSPA